MSDQLLALLLRYVSPSWWSCWRLPFPHASTAQAQTVTPDSADFFESRIRPLLSEKCWSCHGQDKQQGGLRLDSRQAMLDGGDRGPAIEPGDPENSLLVTAVRPLGRLAQDAAAERPPARRRDRLSHSVGHRRRTLASRDCSRQVATGPETDTADHWAFQPVRKPAVPSSASANWLGLESGRLPSSSPRSRSQDLAPSPSADRRTSDPPPHVRPDRPAANTGRGRRFPERLDDPNAYESPGRPPARLAPLRRALGASLARRRPLRRHQGLRLPGRSAATPSPTPIATG